MTDQMLTKKQAYLAMYLFIENLYSLTKDDSLGIYLGSMQLGRDGEPFDQAYWEDWHNAVQKVLDLKTSNDEVA